MFRIFSPFALTLLLFCAGTVSGRAQQLDLSARIDSAINRGLAYLQARGLDISDPDAQITIQAFKQKGLLATAPTIEQYLNKYPANALYIKVFGRTLPNAVKPTAAEVYAWNNPDAPQQKLVALALNCDIVKPEPGYLEQVKTTLASATEEKIETHNYFLNMLCGGLAYLILQAKGCLPSSQALDKELLYHQKAYSDSIYTRLRESTTPVFCSLNAKDAHYWRYLLLNMLCLFNQTARLNDDDILFILNNQQANGGWKAFALDHAEIHDNTTATVINILLQYKAYYY